MDLRANTAVDVLIGPFIDKTDGNTTEDALTLTAAEIKLSKNGQALTLKTDATAAAFDDDGYYNCELDATDTNTEGNLVLIVHQSANALPVRHEYNVMAEAAWDSLYAAKDTGFMDVNIKELGDAAQSMTDLKDFADAGYDPATNKVQGVVLVDTLTTYTSNTVQSGDAYAYLGTNLGAIGANATEAGGTGDHLTAINLPNQTMDIVGSITGNLSGSVGSVTGAVGSVTGAVGSVTAGVTLAAGAVTDASLAGNMEIVFETDFATNYNTTRNAWATNAQDFVGTTASDPFNAKVVAASLTGHTVQTGDSFARIGVAGVGLTDIQLPADGLDLIVPGIVSAVPVLGTSSIAVLAGWLANLNINKVTTTATTMTTYNAAAGAIATSTVSDDATTATVGAWS